MLALLGISISIIVDGTENGMVNTATRQIQVFQETYSYMWVSMILLSILVITGIFYYKIYRYFTQGLYSDVGTSGLINGTGDYTLDKAIELAGYSYDLQQDIFYSNIDAWQREQGYCRLYDEAAAPLGMIIDCEPIYFEYHNKRWLIEFWKGQYDLTTGCEIGVYATEEPDLDIPSVFKGAFYRSVDNVDLLKMSFSLKKNGKILFTREDKHWWLTGFKLGEFSQPSELTMVLSITLKDKDMCKAFVKGLKNAGYWEDEIIITGNTVDLKFDETRTQQPLTRRPKTDFIIQRKNKLLCDRYQDITRGYDNLPDKINAIKEQAPEMYEQIINLGKTRQLFDKYKKIKEYLS